MKRITKEGFNFTSDFVASNLQSYSIAEALTKLQQYEDIGLTPEEIKVFLGDFGILQAMKIRELKKNKVKRLISLLSTLKFPDKLFIYDDKELAWQGYISEKQIYKHLENKEVVEMYLGEDGLIAIVN